MEGTTAHPLGRAGDVWHVRSAFLAAAGLPGHWFLGRRDGASTGAYASLNLSRSVGDDEAAVDRNRAVVREALGLPRPPVLIRQVHGNRVVVLDRDNLEAVAADPPEADALVTALPGVPLAVLTADCVPVIVFDRATPALGVVHAGWRGTVRSATFKALLTMMEVFGTDPAACTVALGPAIAGPCYEVGEDVREAFVKGLPYGQDVLTAAGEFKWRANLREANRRQALDARIPASRVDVLPFCTHCEAAWFFSARRDGARGGRQAAVAMLG